MWSYTLVELEPRRTISLLSLGCLEVTDAVGRVRYGSAREAKRQVKTSSAPPTEHAQERPLLWPRVVPVGFGRSTDMLVVALLKRMFAFVFVDKHQVLDSCGDPLNETSVMQGVDAE